MSTHNLRFEQKYEKYKVFYLFFLFFGGKIFSIFEYACFRNEPTKSWNFPVFRLQSVKFYLLLLSVFL